MHKYDFGVKGKLKYSRSAGQLRGPGQFSMFAPQICGADRKEEDLLCPVVFSQHVTMLIFPVLHIPAELATFP